MTKYMTSGFSVKLIQKVEIVKETEKTLWVKKRNWNGKEMVEQCRKSTNWHQYFDSWEEAKDYLVSQAQKEVNKYELALERAKVRLAEMKSLERSD